MKLGGGSAVHVYVYILMVENSNGIRDWYNPCHLT